MKAKLHNVEQGTPEWHALRLGKMTASHAHTISVAGKGLETYCSNIAAEIYTGQTEEGYRSEDMIIGSEQEDIARSYYELLTGAEVEQIGFAEYDEYVGCSPDGLIGKDGGLEIKRRSFKVYKDLLLGRAELEPQYIWQCHMNMLILDRQWWDLANYNPLFKDKSMLIVRFERSKEADEKLLAGFNKGKDLIKQYLEILNK